MNAIGVLDVQQQVEKDGLTQFLSIAPLLPQCRQEYYSFAHGSVHIQLVHHHGHECLILTVIPHVGPTGCHTLLSERTLSIGNHEAIQHCLVRVVHDQVTSTAHRVTWTDLLSNNRVLLQILHHIRMHPTTHSSTRNGCVQSIVSH